MLPFSLNGFDDYIEQIMCSQLDPFRVWRECEGVEPSADDEGRPPADLKSSRPYLNKPHKLVNSFLTEKEYQGLSPETIKFYRGYLTKDINKSAFPTLAGTQLQITRFLSSQ